MSRIKNRAGHRVCIGCRQELALTSENFHNEKRRPYGLSYRCRPCEAIRAKTKPARHLRWQNMTPLQRASKSAANKRVYVKTPQTIHRLRSYKAIDKRKGHFFDLDVEWYAANIEGRPCHYCGDTERIGCDRIDNREGHHKNNVIPCCLGCNIARGDRFSYDEMVIIGEAVKKVKIQRRKNATFSIEEFA